MTRFGYRERCSPAEQAPLLLHACPPRGLVLRARGPDVSPQSGVTSLGEGQHLVTGLGRQLVSLWWQGLQEAAAERGRKAGTGILFGVISPVPLESSPGE